MTKRQVAEKIIHVQLFGGEKDGWHVDIPTVNGTFPRMFYVHRNCDDKQINDVECDEQLHELLSESLAILAYCFKDAEPKEGVPGNKEYRYTRCEHADRSLKDAAM